MNLLTGHIMITLSCKTTIRNYHRRGIVRTLWLVAMLVLSPIAVASDHSPKTTKIETGDTRVIPEAGISLLSDRTLGCFHAKRFFREAPVIQIPAVILWDETESVRRTGSGLSNTQSSGSTLMASRE